MSMIRRSMRLDWIQLKTTRGRTAGGLILIGALILAACSIKQEPMAVGSSEDGGTYTAPPEGISTSEDISTNIRTTKAIITPPARDAGNPALCGNGVLEKGEVCDPGLQACCNSRCAGVRAAGVLCRMAEGACDAPESCGGSSAECPADTLIEQDPSCNPDPEETPATLPDAMTGACATPTGPGVKHSGTISADETWTAADSPHVVTFDLRVVGATLTIEPCAVVRVMEGYTISVGGGNPGDPDAKLVARGTSDGTSRRPVTFTSDDETKYWGTLHFNKTGTADLEQVVLHHAGNPATAQNLGGALVIFGDSNGKVPTRTVRAKSLLIDASASLGINIQRSGGFTEDSEDVVVQNSGNASPSANADTMYPVYVQMPSTQTIPPGSYTGNVKDAILVANPANLDGDETFHDRGVPYRLRDGLSISPSKSAAEGGLATLTLDPGVTLKLLKTTNSVLPGIRLGRSNGNLPENISPTRLIAAGTPEKPILITSDADVPASGDWAGIGWSGGPGTGNVMTYVTVEYAGGRSGTQSFGCGPTSNDAALIFAHWKPEETFIQNCTFAHSLGGAIVSGWNSDSGPNFKPGNTFIDIAASCQVSQPVPTAGCPATELCY